MARRIIIIEAIEMGLNMLAQDLVFESHAEKDIDNYINQFKFEDIECFI